MEQTDSAPGAASQTKMPQERREWLQKVDYKARTGGREEKVDVAANVCWAVHFRQPTNSLHIQNVKNYLQASLYL